MAEYPERGKRPASSDAFARQKNFAMQDSDTPPAGDSRAFDLAGRVWQLTELETAVLAKQPRDRVPYLEFHADEGRVSGSTGVNRLSAPCTWDARTISIGMLATTRRAGPPEDMQREHAFVVALAGVDSWVIEARELCLTTNGVVTMRLRASSRRTLAP